MADSYLDLLGEEEFETYVPPTSETQAYLDWESTAARDRFSDEYSLQAFSRPRAIWTRYFIFT